MKATARPAARARILTFDEEDDDDDEGKNESSKQSPKGRKSDERVIVACRGQQPQ